MSNPFIVIDLGLVRDGVAPPELLAQIRQAGETVGVLQVINHGVPQELIDEHDRRTTALLARPREEKAAFASPTGHPYRGWRQWPDDLGRLELERFMFARFDDVESAVAAGVDRELAEHDYTHRNVWPEDDPGYEDLALEFRAEIIALAERLLRVFAQALGVPEDSFASVGPDTTSVTFNKYPTWTWPDDATDEDKLLLLEHADGNAITILNQAGDYPGLQVQQPDGTWVGVPIIDGALQVFFGGLLSRWTNERWLPGRHRVVSGGQQVRHSTAVFYGPGFDTVVAPIPELLAEGEEPLFDPITIAEQTRDFVDDYLRVFARPDQLEAWQKQERFVAEVRERASGFLIAAMTDTAASTDQRAPVRLDDRDLIALVEQVANGDPHAVIPAGDARRWGLAYATPDVEVWVIEWPPGSGLEMHDHDDSTAAVRVIDGRLRERYVYDGDVIMRWLGGRTFVLPRDHVHEVINTETIPAVSIHAYSPPIAEMSFRDDPAFDVTKPA